MPRPNPNPWTPFRRRNTDRTIKPRHGAFLLEHYGRLCVDIGEGVKIMTKKTDEQRIEDLRKRLGAAKVETEAEGVLVFKDTAGTEIKRGTLDEVEAQH